MVTAPDRRWWCVKRLESFQKHTMSREDADGTSLTLNEKEVLYKLLPVAFIFMCLVFGASTVRLSRSPPPPTFALALSPFSLSRASALARAVLPCCVWLPACCLPRAARPRLAACGASRADLLRRVPMARYRSYPTRAHATCTALLRVIVPIKRNASVDSAAHWAWGAGSL